MFQWKIKSPLIALPICWCIISQWTKQVWCIILLQVIFEILIDEKKKYVIFIFLNFYRITVFNSTITTMRLIKFIDILKNLFCKRCCAQYTFSPQTVQTSSQSSVSGHFSRGPLFLEMNSSNPAPLLRHHYNLQGHSMGNLCTLLIILTQDALPIGLDSADLLLSIFQFINNFGVFLSLWSAWFKKILKISNC